MTPSTSISTTMSSSTVLSTEKSSLYRLLESLPGLLSWGIITVLALILRINVSIFAAFMLVFMLYWISSCVSIVTTVLKGLGNINAVKNEDWISRLKAEYPDWTEYHYCTILPFASESINVIRPTLEALANSDFPNERKILVLSSEAALPKGRKIAEELAEEFSSRFGQVHVIEHTLKTGELKGKASNENFAGRFTYDKLIELGIDPAKVLVSSNDADMKIESEYPGYLLHSYLSEGDNRDNVIYQPIPADLEDYWKASFFTRMLVLSGILWRITLQVRGGLRCTVFAFYSMSMKTLNNIGFWDADVIPEDERTMFKAINAFGPDFHVHPLFIITKGVSVRGEGLAGAAAEQYTQIRRWAWGASEIAHSMSLFSGLDEKGKKAIFMPILNQIRSAVEWSLAPMLLVFGGFLPGFVSPEFAQSTAGEAYALAMTIIAAISTLLLLCTIVLESRIAPPRPDSRRTASARILGFAQWFLTPAVSLAFGALPALDAQTRLILNKRIAYVESRKE